MDIPKRNELKSVLRGLLSELAEYDYIMGDVGMTMRPWVLLEGRHDELATGEPGDTWLAECSIVAALAIQWGIKDGAHTMDVAERKLMVDMVSDLRRCSERAEEIAHAFDLVASDDESATSASNEILNRYIKSGELNSGQPSG